MFDPHRLQHADVAALGRQRLGAGLVERLDERSRTAVEDRQLRTVDVDREVVDAQRVDRRHQMLDGGDGAPRRITEHSRQV